MTQAALDLGQQIQQRADGGRLGRAARADQQDSANGRVDQPQQERQLHFPLADDGQEGEGHCLGQPGFFSADRRDGFAGDKVHQLTQAAERVRHALFGLGLFGGSERGQFTKAHADLYLAHAAVPSTGLRRERLP